MLDALEDYLSPAIDAALPGGVDVITGPWTPSGNGGVVISACTLEVEAPAEEPPADEAAHLLSVVDFDANGSELDFEIPAPETGELIEVEAPPGVTAARGDAYYLDDRTIRFYQSPPAGSPGVRARLRGDQAQGWKRRRACEIQLMISGWANTSSGADSRLAIALQVALAELASLPNLEAVSVVGVQVQLRIRKPRVWIKSIERCIETSSNLIQAKATIELHAELDVLVAKGEPAPVGVIASIAGQLSTDHADGQPALPESFVVTGQPSLPAAGPRPIEAEPLSSLVSVGAQAVSDFNGLSSPITTMAGLAQLDVSAIAGELVNLSEAAALGLRHRARLVLAFPTLPSLPAPALASSLATLLAQDLATLSATLTLGSGYAAQLYDELLTLQVLLKSAALSTLTLGDFVAS